MLNVYTSNLKNEMRANSVNIEKNNLAGAYMYLELFSYFFTKTYVVGTQKN